MNESALPTVILGAGFTGLFAMLHLLSFILAFGLIGPGGLLLDNQGNWDKNVFMLIGAGICAAFDHYLVTRKEQLNGFWQRS